MRNINKVISRIVGRSVPDGDTATTPTHFTNDGSTGIEIFSGDYVEDYLRVFQDMPCGMEKYDEMRRSDPQIQMLLRSIKNPIMSAKWQIEPVDDSDEEKEIADFISFALFQNMGYPDGSKTKTWNSFVYEALSNIDFGFSMFEIVHKIATHPRWGTYVGIRDLGFRSQKTIYSWNLNKNGSIKSVRQMVDGDLDVDVNIPGHNLLVFSANKEGDNYEGISYLRAVYGNWFRKNVYNKLQAIGIERSSTGIPIGKIPLDKVNDAQQKEDFRQILQRFTAHQSNYITLPEGFEIEMFKLQHDPDKLDSVIESEDKRMAKAFLANFMELAMGKGSGGAYSLGTDLSDIFLNGIQLFAEQISTGVQDKVIKTLVDANFGIREDYPQLRVSNINDKAGRERAEIIVMLKSAGLLKDSEQLEDRLAVDYDLPILSDEQKKEIEEKSDTEDNTLPIELSEGPANSSLYIKDRSKAAFMMMHEQLTVRTDKYLDNVKSFLNKEENTNVRRLNVEKMPIPGRSEYKQKLKLFLAQVSDEAVRNVNEELNKGGLRLDEADDILRGLPKEVRDKVKNDVDLIIDAQDGDMRKMMLFLFSQKLDTTDSVDKLIADMREARDRYTDGPSLRAGSTNAVAGAVNTARNAVFQTPEVFEEIESFVIVNPDPQAAICKELAGRVFTKDEYLNQDLPPYHHNCQTTVRAQLVGNRNKPINPIGLAFTGSQEQVEAIMRSKTFDEGCNHD